MSADVITMGVGPLGKSPASISYHRGQAHRAAIVLGLKPDPEATPEVTA